MTDLLDQDAPDVDDFVVTWLQPVIRAAIERETDDVLPFCVVTRVAGDDDQDCGFNSAVIQLDVFARGVVAAKQASKTVRRRMNYLARYLDHVPLSDGAASASYVSNQIDFTRAPYADEQIVRLIARYAVGIPYVAV